MRNKFRSKMFIRFMQIFLTVACVIGALFFCLNGKDDNQTGAGDKENAAKEINYEVEKESGSEEADKLTTVIEEKPQEVLIQEKKDAPYEHWLAAGMVVAISMKFPEFELEDIYLTAETEVFDKSSSEGVYIVFESEGEIVMIHSEPLAEERKESGTTDLYTEYLGFSTFDTVKKDVNELKDCKKIEPDQLNELISQSLLVSIYEH